MPVIWQNCLYFEECASDLAELPVPASDLAELQLCGGPRASGLAELPLCGGECARFGRIVCLL
jgi:hypothetical protein